MRLQQSGIRGLWCTEGLFANHTIMSKGWVGFDYAKGLGCPVKVINDAAMQAIGSYRGGRMLFLGLGTGLGSAMIVDAMIEPMELAHLPYKKGKTYEDFLGLRGLKRMGKKKWRRYVARIVKELQTALNADYVVLGGGNVKKIISVWSSVSMPLIVESFIFPFPSV